MKGRRTWVGHGREADLVLEVWCDDCGGRGWVDAPDAKPDEDGEYPEVKCGACKGRGSLLTEQGEAIMSMIARHQGLAELIGRRIADYFGRDV